MHSQTQDEGGNIGVGAVLGQPLVFKRMSGCNLTGSGFAELHTNVFDGRMSGENPELSPEIRIAALTG
ncbi:uncharacterized protein FFB20_15214 [Fusarium fujikuroi]|uniref:Uncharacterized protein n=1 Tax=Gibberella fujikuroi (strain CBS 195.34 / IMI 58289 / NRRL A-6831) TaxID=1279085 RepID=S0DN36_GIBF5|nr:uncharacterized protein FFUJ_00609 [Fusarium fujikuroi IMI 58289]KLP02934.1 uncharacterized protein Y057_9736 [Fusarium fujikuroi]CCT62802.1 uncharacterized protein FFUJ_00609 [Fusarium fujikuroi IMI 58289]SCN66775.1 uncharacterized protein FFE2_00670 [Fusarium fujikuroi]SCN69772.1 uncharacterized protein FFC1_00666 [Fusarium fujikuroi]SCN73301.1 uncharacterized protein FFM5_00629 [Fusarium fujikuroi]